MFTKLLVLKLVLFHGNKKIQRYVPNIKLNRKYINHQYLCYYIKFIFLSVTEGNKEKMKSICALYDAKKFEEFKCKEC